MSSLARLLGRWPRLAASTATAALLLTACGGGGGDDAPRLSLSLSPSSVSQTISEGRSYEFTETARVTGSVSGDVVIVIVDQGGVIEPDVGITQFSETDYAASFRTRSSLAVGNYSSRIDVKLCSDTRCSRQYGAASFSYSFTVVAAPKVQLLLPDTATTGSSFRLNVDGSGFTEGATILLDGRPVPTTMVFATRLTAELTGADTSRAGPINVMVRNDRPANAVSNGMRLMIDTPPPTLTSISPRTATVGSPGFLLTVTGTQFMEDSIVVWRGEPRNTSYVSPTELKAEIGSGDVANPGPTQVVVRTPAPGGGTSMPVTFDTVFPAPALTLINAKTAAAGCGRFLLTVVGDNVGNYSTVRWNGQSRPTTQIGEHVLQAEIPATDIASTGSAAVSIFNPSPGGGVSSTAPFTITSTGPAATDATAFQLNPGHTGVASTKCPVSLPPASAWTTTLDGDAGYPLAVGNRAFVVSAAGQLSALDLANGAPVWGPIATAGAGLAHDRGALFLSSNAGCCSSGGLVKSYDAATGALRFSVTLPGQFGSATAITALGGFAYVGSNSSVYALNGNTGAMAWNAGISGSADSSTPAVTSAGVHVSYPCQSHAFNPTSGARIWSTDTGCSGGGGATPVVANGSMYAPDGFGTYDGPIRAAQTGVARNNYAADVPPAIDAQVGYFLKGGTLRAIRHSDNLVLWSFGGDGGLTTSPVVVNQVVFVGSAGGQLYALDAVTGRQLWSSQFPAGLAEGARWARAYAAAPAIGNGVLLVPSGATVTAFRLALP